MVAHFHRNLHVEWSKNGGLRYRVENSKEKQIKTIEPELLVMSKYWQSKGIEISYKLLKDNKHDNFCTAPVINYLLSNF
jgi:hypothetical protein